MGLCSESSLSGGIRHSLHVEVIDLQPPKWCFYCFFLHALACATLPYAAGGGDGRDECGEDGDDDVHDALDGSF